MKRNGRPTIGVAMATLGRQVAAAAAMLTPVAAAAAGGPLSAAVTTPGSGDLTMCRDWFVYNACDTYHHVALPDQIAIGDQLSLVFGSSDKEYDFRVVGINRRGDHCTIKSPHTRANDSGERLVVVPCQPAAKPAQ
jgi:hypothetical protein